MGWMFVCCEEEEFVEIGRVWREGGRGERVVPTDYDGLQQEQEQLSSVHRVTLFDNWRGVGRRRGELSSSG